MFGVNWWMDEAVLLFCNLFDGFCESMIAAVADADPEVDNFERLEPFMANFPSGSSYQDLVFFGQNVVNDTFKQFNYGEKDNLSIYGRIEPPNVPLKNFSLPTALFQGNSDRLADAADVEWLAG